jgi:dipeptidyl aminopeptidase/acylaminoacyl peptidase
MPPFLFVHGTDDSVVPLDQSTAMCDAIRNVGSLCEVLTVEGGGHGLREWETDPRRAAYKSGLIAWLQARLK